MSNWIYIKYIKEKWIDFSGFAVDPVKNTSNVDSVCSVWGKSQHQLDNSWCETSVRCCGLQLGDVQEMFMSLTFIFTANNNFWDILSVNGRHWGQDKEASWTSILQMWRRSCLISQWAESVRLWGILFLTATWLVARLSSVKETTKRLH